MAGSGRTRAETLALAADLFGEDSSSGSEAEDEPSVASVLSRSAAHEPTESTEELRAALSAVPSPVTRALAESQLVHWQTPASQQAEAGVLGLLPRGLVLVRGLLSGHLQRLLAGSVQELYRLDSVHNQAQDFELAHVAFLPALETALRTCPPLFACNQAVWRRRPLFSQLIANRYQPGEGLAAHCDLPHRYADGIISLSLGSACRMVFASMGDGGRHSCSVLLQPGDLLCMCADARWRYTHGIPVGPTHTRTSITLRSMLR